MDGVALLLTALLELISGFGLAALTALYSARDQHRSPGTPEGASLAASVPDTALREGAWQSVADQLPSRSQGATLLKPSPKAIPAQRVDRQGASRREGQNPPSNVLSLRPRTLSGGLPVRQSGSPSQSWQLPLYRVGMLLQFRVHMIPRLCAGSEDIRLRLKGCRIVQTSHLESEDIRQAFQFRH